MASFTGEIVVTTSTDGPIAAYDPLSGSALVQFSASRSPRRGLALAGSSLIAVSHVSSAASGFVRLYSWWCPAAVQCIPLPEPVAPLAAPSDGSWLFAGGLSGQVHVLSLPSGDLLRSFVFHRQPVSCLAINDDGSLLISGSDDGTMVVFPIIHLLDASSDDKDDSSQPALCRITAHSMAVSSIASAPGGFNSTVVSCSLDGTVKLWNLSAGVCLRTVCLPSAASCVTVDAAKSEIYAGGADGVVYMIPLTTTTRKRFMGDKDEVVVMATTDERSHGGAVVALAMLNGDRHLVAASEDGPIRILETGTRALVQVLGHGQSGLSELVVARGVTAKASGARGGDGGGCLNGGRSSACVREVCGGGGDVKEVEGLEELARLVVKERRRAIDGLEAAIEAYKRLLGLLLKEAEGGDAKEEDGKGF